MHQMWVVSIVQWPGRATAVDFCRNFLQAGNIVGNLSLERPNLLYRLPLPILSHHSSHMSDFSSWNHLAFHRFKKKKKRHGCIAFSWLWSPPITIMQPIFEGCRLCCKQTYFYMPLINNENLEKGGNIYVPWSQKSLANTSILQRLALSCITSTSNGPVGSQCGLWVPPSGFGVKCMLLSFQILTSQLGNCFC